MNTYSLFHTLPAALPGSTHKPYYTILCFFILSLGITSVFSQNTDPKYLDHPFAVSFADGTSAHLSIDQWDEFDFYLPAKDVGTMGIRVSIADKDKCQLISMVTGDFILKFRDREIIHFSIDDTDDEWTTDFPDQLILPFSLLVKGNPDQEVTLSDRSLQVIFRQTIDASGYLWLDNDLTYYADKFIWTAQSGQLPQILPFREIKTNALNRLGDRTLSLPNSQLRVNPGFVHQLDRDVHYTVQTVKFSDLSKGDIRLLTSYSPSIGKGNITNLQIPAERSNMVVGSLALDDMGDLVLPIGNLNYRVELNGKLVEDPAISISPYRFGHNYVDEYGQWLIPVFAGIALPEGAHEMTVRCEGSWYVPSAEQVSWSKRYGEVEKEIYELYAIIQKTNTPSERYNDLLKERDALSRKKPQNPGQQVSGTQESSESFQVIYTPDKEYPWTLDGEFNDSEDPDDDYYPSGIDPESKLHEMDIETCTIEVDGSEPMTYWYIEENVGKGIMYMDWDNEEDRKAAVEAAFKNATRYIGFGTEEGPWRRKLDLFDDNTLNIRTLPVNTMEGPYPELRYTYDEVTGTFPNIKEARQACASPRHNKGKYHCYEEKMVAVCLDNYAFGMENDRIVTNYDALYCKEVAARKDPSKGEEIVVSFSAKGHITETRALSKRQLEMGDILLSGHVHDVDGVEIEGATVRLKGVDGFAETDDAGIYHLTARAQGTRAHSEVMDIRLQPIRLEFSHEDLGIYEDQPYGLVSDGFTTLKIHVKASGIRPQTVSVKPAVIGDFVEQSVLKVPLVLNSQGEGILEYVPPAYLKAEDLTVQIPLTESTAGKYGLQTSLWAAELPVEFTYEDEAGNAGSRTIGIYVTRPPILLIHGFTGNETTWADLGKFLRDRKYEPIIREYYKGPADESTIERQSQKIETYIRDLREAFLDNGFLQTRVDIVAHSMGGLMSRHYISNMARYGEKSGIYIPYNVKLSRDELAARRFTEVVKLIDVRKLIMVGTPNHGASWIDEQIGALSAWSSGFHHVANGQLRSDSPFLSRLNTGENDGRHLDRHVQYALLYGRRRLAPHWPPDVWKYQYNKAYSLVTRGLTDDDGVVMVASALLNGVARFPFPPQEGAPFGFIHSPALGPIYMGDSSITTHIDIFNKVDELLLEDIPRMPLKNAYTTILRQEGEGYLRYFSTEEWKPIASAVSSRLDNPWCQIKTNAGTTSLAFYLDGHHWSSLHIQANTTLYIETVSPEMVKVYLEKGRARFRSRKPGGGGFEVILGEQGEKWYNFNPSARVRDVQTDFTVERNDRVEVQSLHGNLVMGIGGDKTSPWAGRSINSGNGLRMIGSADVEAYTVTDSGWWSSIDTTFLEDEVPESTVGPSLVMNGSFEEGPPVGAYRILRQGESIPGWSVDRATVDLTGTYFDTPEGFNSVDLVGTPGYGAISQILTTTPGDLYQLNFLMAGNPVGRPTVKILRVEAGDQQREFTFDITGKTVRDMGWEAKTWTFRATEESTRLAFSAVESDPRTNYGPAIDDIRVFRLADENWIEPPEEKVVPVEDIGQVTIRLGEAYLPVSGFTDITLEARNTHGTPLASPYEVEVSMVDHEALSFVDIGQPSGTVDAAGSYKTSIMMNEPDPNEYASLADIPLEMGIQVLVYHPRTRETVYDTVVRMPLGMTLLWGTTTGPDFEPRQEPLPPEFFDPSYQIANQADEAGQFYILFNTTLFDQDIDRFKKLAQRRQELFSMDIFDFSIAWSGATSLGLSYVLPSPVIDRIQAGQVVALKEDGFFDLLRPEEHEARVRDRVIAFAEGLPLKTNQKTALLSQIKTLVFTYGSEQVAVPPNVRLSDGQPQLYTPTAPEVYWTAEFVQDGGGPAYVGMWHAVGHVLYEALVAAGNQHYGILTGRCAGDENLWTHQVYQEETSFDLAEYVSFYEAGADLFAWLMVRHMENREDPFMNQSIYANPGYLPQFNTRDKAMECKSRYPALAVSGPQTTFLVEYYGQAGIDDPVAVYAAFLADHLRHPRGQHIAKTFAEWLMVQDGSVTGVDPYTMAGIYGMNKSQEGIWLYPMAGFATAAVELNGAIISDFSDVPRIALTGNTHIRVLEGTFDLERMHAGITQQMTLFKDAVVQVSQDHALDYQAGTVWSTSPFTLRNRLAAVRGENLGCYVLPDEEDVVVYVLKGAAQLVSEKDDRLIGLMEFGKINKKGKIKKPKKIEPEMLEIIREQVLRKYPIVDPFLPVSTAGEVLGVLRD